MRRRSEVASGNYPGQSTSLVVPLCSANAKSETKPIINNDYIENRNKANRPTRVVMGGDL
jgi:hypothetical protein